MGRKRKQLKGHESSLAVYSPPLPTGGPPRRPKLSLQICFHVSTPSIVQCTVFQVLHRVM